MFYKTVGSNYSYINQIINGMYVVLFCDNYYKNLDDRQCFYSSKLSVPLWILCYLFVPLLKSYSLERCVVSEKWEPSEADVETKYAVTFESRMHQEEGFVSSIVSFFSCLSHCHTFCFYTVNHLHVFGVCVWYGHATRWDGLTKVILQGTVEGKRRRGIPKKSWSDNIAECAGKSFAETQAMAHNRQEWRDCDDEKIRHDAPLRLLVELRGQEGGGVGGCG